MKVWFADKYGDTWLKKFEKAVADAEAAVADEINVLWTVDYNF